MEKIRLDEFLMYYYGYSSGQTSDNGEALQQVKHDRDRELSMRKIIDPRIVRRLDAGFARSNTVHPDTGSALYSICFASGTQNVFETGTYWGFSTAYLASALKDKQGGKVHTFDIYQKAGKHIPKSLMPFVEMHKGHPSIEMMPSVLAEVVPELFFQDSRHDYEGVKEELEVIAPYLKRNAVVIFHDFVESEVRRAATDVLGGYTIHILASSDPQQLGIAVNDRK